MSAQTYNIRRRSSWSVFLACIVAVLTLSACTQHTDEISDTEKEYVRNLISEAKSNADSLQALNDRFAADGNIYGIILTCKELGKKLRDRNQFDDAIRIHSHGLERALAIHDTIESVQALNNIGTDYRRKGDMMKAAEFHYQALNLAEQSPDTCFNARKNRVVALNGIGNIQLTLGNLNEADSAFRKALAGEINLGSALGQAINYANIGSIFESKENYDSAYQYYSKSLKLNIEAKSELGIALCHNHLGNIHEKLQRYNEAIDSYQEAYNLMKESSDRWHWLESSLSLIRVYLELNDNGKARALMNEAFATASEINSIEHLSRLSLLAYRLYSNEHNYQCALEYYVKSQEYADSMANEKAQSKVKDVMVDYEREKGNRRVSDITATYNAEKKTKQMILISGIIIVVLLLVFIALLWYSLKMKEKSQKALKRIDQIRTNLLRNITHEFRTPLTIILGLTELLKKDNVDSNERQSCLNSITTQGNNLLSLVNQILEMSRLTANIATRKWLHSDISPFVGEIVNSYSEYAKSRDITLTFNSSFFGEIDFVPEYITNIIRNLMSNALKFTPANGCIEVAIARNNNNVVITVADTGTGIENDDLPNIFETFYQGKNANQNNGTGIGLSYISQIVKSINGHITAANRKDCGAIFTVTLPTTRPDNDGIMETDSDADTTAVAEIAADTVPADSVPAGNRASVLIVDDNNDIARYMHTLLKDKYNLLHASNGKEALEIAETTMPDIILSDVMMPEMDGYQLCNAIRESQILNHIPMVIISAKCEDADRLQGLKEGADAYLIKPFNADELNIIISNLLEQRRMLREKFSSALKNGTEESVQLNSRDTQFIEKVSSYIRANISSHDINPDSLADHMCMSRSQLNRKIRAITDFSTGAYIIQLKIEAAKQMLTNSSTPIGEIAAAVGYDDTSYFSRVFKQYVGSTPSQFRS